MSALRAAHKPSTPRLNHKLACRGHCSERILGSPNRLAAVGVARSKSPLERRASSSPSLGARAVHFDAHLAFIHEIVFSESGILI